MSYFTDYEIDYDDFTDYEIEHYDDYPKCYRCKEECYWEDKELYDFDINIPHICKDKMMATAEDFED